MTRRRLRWSVIAASVFGATAAIIAVGAGFLVGFAHPFPVVVVIGAFATGGVLRYLLIESPQLPAGRCDHGYPDGVLAPVPP